MREYILTTKERDILTRFIMSGKKENGFRTLITRTKRSKSKLDLDLELINKALTHLK